MLRILSVLLSVLKAHHSYLWCDTCPTSRKRTFIPSSDELEFNLTIPGITGDMSQVRRPTSPTATSPTATSPTTHKSDDHKFDDHKSDDHKSDVGMCDSTRYIRQKGGNDVCGPKIDPKMLFFSTL